jgi:Ca2+-binding EF-hand superfamily protein
MPDDEFMERLRLRSVFHFLDKNRNGHIELKVFSHMLKLIGFSPNPHEIMEMFNFMDVDHDGQVSFDEFCECCDDSNKQ